jgi:hypothetical protein
MEVEAALFEAEPEPAHAHARSWAGVLHGAVPGEWTYTGRHPIGQACASIPDEST